MGFICVTGLGMSRVVGLGSFFSSGCGVGDVRPSDNRT